MSDFIEEASSSSPSSSGCSSSDWTAGPRGSGHHAPGRRPPGRLQPPAQEDRPPSSQVKMARDLQPPPRDDHRQPDRQGLHHGGLRAQEVPEGDRRAISGSTSSCLDLLALLAVHGVHRRRRRRLHPLRRHPDRIAQGHISPGDFGAFAMAIFSMFTPIKRLSRANNVIQQAVALPSTGSRRSSTSAPQIQDRPTAYPLPPVQGRVPVRKGLLRLRPDRPVLFDVDRLRGPAPPDRGPRRPERRRQDDHHQPPLALLRADAGRITIDGIDITDVTLTRSAPRSGS